MDHFKNKVCWITGASSGIGKQIALQLSARGALVVLSARREDELRKVAESCPNSFVLPMDLNQINSFPEKVEEVMKKFGRIDIVFHNGGISQRGEVSETALEVDRRIMEINFFAPVALTKAVLPIMQKQNSGYFVVTSSIAGKFGFFLRSAYSSSKHALHGFFESLRLEEEKNNIGVTIVCPGKINTDISLNALSADGKTHGVMDHNQATGMSAEDCARKIIRATEKKKFEVLIGGKELLAARIKRIWPWLFYKIIRKQKAV